MAMQLQLQLPSSCHILRARDSCHRVVHGPSFVSQSRRRAMRREDGGRYLATNRPAHTKIRLGKRRSISRVFPRVSPHPTEHLHNGAHQTNPLPPNPPALYTRLPCTHPCGSEGFVSRPLPLTRTLQHRMEGMAMPCCHHIRPGLPTSYTFC